MYQVKQIFSDAKKAFGYNGKIETKDAKEILMDIKQKLASVNCTRILIGSPLLLFFPIFNIITLMLTIHQSSFWLSLITSFVLIAHILIYVFFTLNIIYGKNKKEKLIHAYTHIAPREFWIVWLLCMLVISYCRVLEKRGGLFIVFTWVIISTVPLYRVKEFLLGLFLMLAIGNSGFALLFYSQEMTTYFFYSNAAMFVIGFICQHFQVKSFMIQQYIQIKAFRDPLTGLLNRRGGNLKLEELLHWSKANVDLGVIMLDIDFFKKYNDSFGHDAGDVCLKMVASCIRDAVGERSPLIIRHGGEEFVVLVLKTDMDEMMEIAERIRITVFEKNLETAYKEVADVVTVSVGVSMESAIFGNSYESYIKHADEALYRAKNCGKNQVVFETQVIQ